MIVFGETIVVVTIKGHSVVTGLNKKKCSVV